MFTYLSTGACFSRMNRFFVPEPENGLHNAYDRPILASDEWLRLATR